MTIFSTMLSSMKNLFAFILVLSLFSCKKKETSEEASVLSTTGAAPTPTASPGATFAAEFEVNSTDYNYAYSFAWFYSDNKTGITMNSVKINGKNMGIYSNNVYRYDLASSTYTAPVTWEVSSSVSFIPDTLFVSDPFPAIGYQKDISRLYDKTKDFNITVDLSNCDSMFFKLGEVVKKVPGKTGISTITFKPEDHVKCSVTDSTQVDLQVTTSNYRLVTVRGKTWKCQTNSRSLSHYQYK